MSATGGLDLSFLDEEEANKILEVLERDEQLRRAERDRVSKLQHAKRDLKWLHGVTGEWFEEIQRKKFKNDPDVRSLLQQPLTSRLKKKRGKGDSEDSRMSRSRKAPTPKSSDTGTSLLGLRSPFASLFSFRKSVKQSLKPEPPPDRHSLFSSGNQRPGSAEEKKKFDIYSSTRRVKQLASLFEPRQKRENESLSANAQLEREAFQVLGDLDQKLAQEQSQQFRTIRATSNYRPGGHNPQQGSYSNMPDYRKGFRSSSSSRDETKTALFSEEHKTFATYQPRKFHDMYSNRQRTATKPKQHKNTFEKSPSWCSAIGSKSPSTAPNNGTFSTGSLQHPSMGQQSGYDLERTYQHRPKRTPISSIKWSNQFYSGPSEKQDKLSRAQSAMDLTNMNSCAPENRMYGLYKYKKFHREPMSNTNEFEKANYTNDVITQVYHNYSNSGSFSNYQTNSPNLPTLGNLTLKNEMVSGEENKENTFNSNELKTKHFSEFSTTKGKQVELMETEACDSVEYEVTSQTLMNVDSTFTVHIKENAPDDFHMQSKDIIVNPYLTEKQTDVDETTSRNQESVLNCSDVSMESSSGNSDEDMQLKSSQKLESRYETINVNVPNIPLQSENFNKYISNDLKSTVPDLTVGHIEVASLVEAQHHTPSSSTTVLNKHVLPNRQPCMPDSTSKFAGVLFARSCKYNSSLEHDKQLPTSKNFINSVSIKKSNAIHNSIPDILDKLNSSGLKNDIKTIDKLQDFRCDLLKDQSKNSSSLPDLSDWRSYFSDLRTRNTTLKNNKVENRTFGSTIAQEHISSRRLVNQKQNKELQAGPAAEMRDTIQENILCLQKPDAISYEIKSIKSAQSTETNDRAPMSDDKMCSVTDACATKCLETHSPGFCDLGVQNTHIHPKKEPVVIPGKIEADTNNNRQSIKVLYTSNYVSPSNTVESMTTNAHFPRIETVKDSEHHVLARPLISNNSVLTSKEREPQNKGTPYVIPYTTKALSKLYQGDISVTNQQSNKEVNIASMSLPDTFVKSEWVNSSYRATNFDMPVKNTTQIPARMSENKPEFPSNTSFNPSFTQGVHKYTSNRESGSVDTPNTINVNTFPVERIVEKRFQMHSLNRAASPSSTQNKSTNLLKEHLLLAPEPFKVRTNVKENITTYWDFPASVKEAEPQKSSRTDSTTSNSTINLPTEDRSESENVPPHDTSKGLSSIMQNTQIYETCSTDSDKIEYQKLISICYSLPRKFAKRLPDSSLNMMHIDKTLENSKAPSALLEKTRQTESKEKSYPEYLNSRKPLSPSTAENIRADEFGSGNTTQSKTRSSSFPITSLQTSLLQKSPRPFSNECNVSPCDDLADSFRSLQISERHPDYNMKQDLLSPQSKDKNNKNRLMDYYNNAEISGKPRWNYYTLPNRKSHTVATVHQRQNTHSPTEHVHCNSRGSNDYSPPTKSWNNNLNQSPTSDFTSPCFLENEKYDNINDIIMRDTLLRKTHSFDEGFIGRQTLPSVHHAKSFHDSYNVMDHVVSPNMGPKVYNQSNVCKIDELLDRTRPSVGTRYIPKDIKKTRNRKQFNFSFDYTDPCDYSSLPYRESFSSSPGTSNDTDSPSVFYSTGDNHHGQFGKHFPGWSNSPDYNHSDLYRSKSMKVLSLEEQQDLVDMRRRNDRHFSSKSHGGTLSSRSPSLYVDSSNTYYNRRFSAEDIIDENDNWPSTGTSNSHKPVYNSKSLDYGIFGKEQQAAFLNNIKRTLTEGRLWRPAYLKNPGFLKNEENFSSSDSPCVSSSTQGTMTQGPSSKEPLNIYLDKAVICSDSDTDTTTDDEYYLDENDKESEL